VPPAAPARTPRAAKPAGTPVTPTRPTPAAYPLEQLQPSAPPPRDSPAGILAEAYAEADRIREQARAEGHAEGLAHGRAEGLAETRAAAQALGAALIDLHAKAEDLAHAVERDAVELALALAAKIVGGALEVQPQRVLDAVAGALRRIADRRRISVLVDPADLELVSAAVGELQARAGGIELCEVQADRRVRRGGAIVRTLESEVDVTIQTQLERAREVIRAELGCEVADQDTHAAEPPGSAAYAPTTSAAPPETAPITAATPEAEVFEPIPAEIVDGELADVELAP
jgi:flagellar assembly protein FliH